MKTHEVLDLHYHPNEGQGCFDGTLKECEDFAATQSPHFMYKVVPMTKEEIERHPDNNKDIKRKFRTLTKFQQDFLLNYFFKDQSHAGWKNIATELLGTGKCVVAGMKEIWIGGIGNFIKTSVAKNTVGCLLYEFDLEYFLASDWYKQVRDEYVSTLSIKKRSVEQEYEEISSF